jgi:hypothetical protein
MDLLEIIDEAVAATALDLTTGLDRSISKLIDRSKETHVLDRFKGHVVRIDSSADVIGPWKQARFRRSKTSTWSIDLVIKWRGVAAAVEGKYKVKTESAVRDSRIDAFYDIFKLEQYVASGQYNCGVFVWWTDSASYLRQATGGSADFSTHQGREYRTNQALNGSSTKLPLSVFPVILTNDYRFMWREFIHSTTCYSLVIPVGFP